MVGDGLPLFACDPPILPLEDGQEGSQPRIRDGQVGLGSERAERLLDEALSGVGGFHAGVPEDRRAEFRPVVLESQQVSCERGESFDPPLLDAGQVGAVRVSAEVIDDRAQALSGGGIALLRHPRRERPADERLQLVVAIEGVEPHQEMGRGAAVLRPKLHPASCEIEVLREKLLIEEVVRHERGELPGLRLGPGPEEGEGLAGDREKALFEALILKLVKRRDDDLPVSRELREELLEGRATLPQAPGGKEHPGALHLHLATTPGGVLVLVIPDRPKTVDELDPLVPGERSRGDFPEEFREALGLEIRPPDEFRRQGGEPALQLLALPGGSQEVDAKPQCARLPLDPGQDLRPLPPGAPLASEGRVIGEQPQPLGQPGLTLENCLLRLLHGGARRGEEDDVVHSREPERDLLRHAGRVERLDRDRGVPEGPAFGVHGDDLGGPEPVFGRNETGVGGLPGDLAV